jgi:hypothetical protein
MAKTCQALGFLLNFSLLDPSIDGWIYGCMDVKQFVIPTPYYFFKVAYKTCLNRILHNIF